MTDEPRHIPTCPVCDRPSHRRRDAARLDALRTRAKYLREVAIPRYTQRRQDGTLAYALHEAAALEWAIAELDLKEKT